jgi:S-adenosylmethionine:tRNA ribosyltransferase-isomerase
LPVKTDAVSDHTMHAEQFTLTTESAEILNKAQRAGQRIIAVGTTTCRVLESCAVAQKNGDHTTYLLQPQTAETSIFIYPPYQFKFVDGLITNFHLPESTLLMLISALVSQPNTPHPFTNFANSIVGNAYHEAIKKNYRFFSFGDAMFIS